jgi:hypothetical protein
MTSLHPYTAVRAGEPGTSPNAAYGDNSVQRAEASPGRSPQHSIFCVSPDLFATCRVPLRMTVPHDRIATLQTAVTYVGNSTFEIRVDGGVIGFIRCADRTFTARAAPRVGQAPDCPQCLLWDEAARELVCAAGFTFDRPNGQTNHRMPTAA